LTHDFREGDLDEQHLLRGDFSLDENCNSQNFSRAGSSFKKPDFSFQNTINLN